MADTDPAATLHALAKWLRAEAERYPGTAWSHAVVALTEHVEGVTQRHAALRVHLHPGKVCDRCTDWGQESDAFVDYPCPEVRELLAVAAAAGVTP